MGETEYNILVVDDEKNINDLFDPLKDILYEEDELLVRFEYMNDISNFKIKKPFDVVMFDSKFLNTKHDYEYNQEHKTIGFNLIESFRKSNKKTKIIFYSSHFDISEPDQIPYGAKDFFRIINDLNIYKMVNKNKTKEIYNAIKDAIDDLDIIMIMLEKMSKDYEGLDIEYEINEENIPMQKLINDFKMGGKISEKFRKEVMDIVLSYMSKFNT
ncbi:hypothetical protein [Bacillus altitudinis]|uniref:hypothetical protein n=1 Tax=Bacillus altitudinis TaxID=293387 RepID=UPI00148ED97A|nr:hypothetical protein [Bacillus altitudinis]NOL31116.1 hypothetical protein [Bacillus altitudinis]